MSQTIHVAVATIVNQQQQVLLALRQAHQHQANLWEFPGGKVEDDELVYDALVREIKEEIDINITDAQPLLIINHDYGDRKVLLDVWHVTAFDGEPTGQEGQQIRWCAISELNEKKLPQANVPIIEALHALL
ncbi:MAG: 8-oxo-dGTP diphosphatase MutT [Gammaproteobacteria bacterium]|nr:8-oxo-dGTP diphosphatase MutT [Gammaproteobacteria bacterium]